MFNCKPTVLGTLKRLIVIFMKPFKLTQRHLPSSLPASIKKEKKKETHIKEKQRRVYLAINAMWGYSQCLVMAINVITYT